MVVCATILRRYLFTTNKHMKKAKRPRLRYESFRRSSNPEELARAYFDLHYAVRFKENWPSMRCAMLSRKKYCSIINNFSPGVETLVHKLDESGAYDFVKELHQKAKIKYDDICLEIVEILHAMDKLRAINAQLELDLEKNPDTELFSINNRNNTIVGCSDGENLSSLSNSHFDDPKLNLSAELRGEDDFHDFIAKYRKESSNEASDQSFNQVPDKSMLQLIDKLEDLHDRREVYHKLCRSCIDLKAYVFPKGDITELNSSVLDSPQKDYYQNFLLDATSVLPVIALDPKPGDQILDMCSAPGGKLSTILQIVKNEAQVVANEPVKPRLAKLQQALSHYLPPSAEIKAYVSFVAESGDFWKEDAAQVFNKVLVDVPCTEDRVSMYESDEPQENIFSEMQKGRRQRLPELQSEILRNAIMACDVNGVVVYCTDTASQWQNEYVIQYTVQDLLSENDVLCEVVDLKPMEELLDEEFYFHRDITVGTLVVPRLDANFGPLYVCKLRRVR